MDHSHSHSHHHDHHHEPRDWSRYRPWLFALLGLIVLYRCYLTVRETEFVLITQFGRPLYTIQDAGLHLKWPFQSATYFDRRLRIYNPRPSEFLTRDKKNLVIEPYVAWRIDDPKRAREEQQRISEQFLEHFRAGLAVIAFERGDSTGTYLLRPWESE